MTDKSSTLPMIAMDLLFVSTEFDNSALRGVHFLLLVQKENGRKEKDAEIETRSEGTISILKFMTFTFHLTILIINHGGSIDFPPHTADDFGVPLE